jgi:hypothetical protein
MRGLLSTCAIPFDNVVVEAMSGDQICNANLTRGAANQLFVTFNIGSRCQSPDTASAAEDCFLGSPPSGMSCAVFAVVAILIPIIVVIIVVIIVIIFTVPKIRSKVLPHRKSRAAIYEVPMYQGGGAKKKTAAEYRNETMQAL